MRLVYLKFCHVALNSYEQEQLYSKYFIWKIIWLYQVRNFKNKYSLSTVLTFCYCSLLITRWFVTSADISIGGWRLWYRMNPVMNNSNCVLLKRNLSFWRAHFIHSSGYILMLGTNKEIPVFFLVIFSLAPEYVWVWMWFSGKLQTHGDSTFPHWFGREHSLSYFSCHGQTQ